MKNSLLLFSLLILIAACKPNSNENNVTREKTFRPIHLEYAKSFRLFEDDDDFKLEITDETNGKTISSYLFPKQITAPPKAALFSSTVIGYLEELNQLQTVIGVEKLNGVYNPKLNEQIKQGKIKEYVDYSLVNPEKLRKDRVNTVFYSLYGPELNPLDEKLKKLEITAIPLLEWKEQHPLGKAEWIKMYGVIYGCFELAEKKFAAIEKEYNKIKDSAAEKVLKDQKVLTSMMFQDIWYLPGGNSYMAKFIKDAGGNYVLKDDSSTGSQSLTFEQVYKKYLHAPIWINVDAKTKKEMLALYDGYKYFDAFKSGRIFTYHHEMLRYFEEAPVKPHLLLNDLVHIFSSENPQNLYFYTKVK